MLLPEPFLQRVQLAVLGETFDRRHRRAVRLDGEYGAGLGAAPVHQHRAGAALAGVATHVGAGEVEVFAQEMDEQGTWLDVGRAHLAVDGYRHLGHGPSEAS